MKEKISLVPNWYNIIKEEVLKETQEGSQSSRVDESDNSSK